MNKLPNELQALVVNRLDRASRARLRQVSKEMRRAVNDTGPPTGVYKNGTGRYQQFWKRSNLYKCADTIFGVRGSYERITRYMEVHKTMPRMDMGADILHVMKKWYANGTLLRDFRDYHTMKGDFKKVTDTDDETSRRKKEDILFPKALRRDFKNRVVRLLKQWSDRDKRYGDTYHMVMRKKKPYTTEEEKMHSDRVLDAAIIQGLSSELFIDLTKDRFTDKNGKVRTIDQKVADLVRLCPAKK